MYDIAVVGARCAGSPTAMLLAGKGYRVRVVDTAAALRGNQPATEQLIEALTGTVAIPGFSPTATSNAY
jgi:flavin-dependent dehydrogenase